MCLMKQKSPKIHESYRNLRDAAEIFGKESTRLQQSSEGNLGLALCNFGMGWLMYTKSDYFITKDFHEDKCLRKAANHFEVSEQIYLTREHYSGRAYCLKALGNLR